MEETKINPENTGPAVPPQVENKVEVPADILQVLLDSNKKMQAEIAILRDAVSQGRLAQAEAKQKPKELPRAFLKVFRGKITVGWKSSTENKIIRNPSTNMPVGEVLQAKYFFHDGTDTGVIDQIVFNEANDRLWCRIVEDKGEKVVLRPETLETPDEDLKQSFVLPGEPIEIHKAFLNP